MVLDALLVWGVSGVLVFIPYAGGQWRRRGPSNFFTWPCFGYIGLGELLMFGLCFIMSSAVGSTQWSHRIDWSIMVLGGLVLCALHYLTLWGAHYYVGDSKRKRALGIG